ncbi:MAG: DUF885 domain-containing protein [Nitrososphaerales archaeon]
MSYSEAFDTLVEDIFNNFMKRDPVSATFMGLHQFDGEMPDGSRETYLKDIESNRRYLSKFEAFHTEDLPRERTLDRELAIHGLKLQIFEDESLRFWESMPNGVNTIGDALFPLFTRNFAPFESRLNSITQRIEKAPRFLEETKSRIRRPVKLWIQIAAESSKKLPLFLDTITSTARSRELDTRRLEEAVKELCACLKEYEEWLSAELVPKAREEFAIGPEKFEDLLGLRGFDMSSGEILAFGESSLRDEKKRLEELSRKIDPDATVEEVKAKIKSSHPATFEESLNLVRQTVQEAKRFVSERSFATIPEGEDLIVMETPSYLRHIIPFAAYFGPARFEPSKVGIYITTPPADGDAEVLGELNYASISNTAVHEGYPGHHLQLTYNALNPSLIRALFHGTEFIEGWAHYCEEAMKTLGWRDTLEARFMQAVDLIWRAARIIIDVKLSTGLISFEEAVDLLVKETGMAKASAVAEVKRYTYTPGYQLSYYLGKHLIKGLKKDAEKLWGDQYSDRRFHDLILGSGGLPIKLLKKVITDSDMQP